MSTIIETLDLLRFVSIENEQFLISLANNRDEFDLISQIQGLYSAAFSGKAAPENDIVVFQLLAFTHYHFLFSTSCLMRCHLSEAFASARAAIDGALIGAQIIHDRPSQVAYERCEKPFDNFARYLGNLIKDGKELPHPLVPTLFAQHKQISTFASHADVRSFVHRVDVVSEPEEMATVEYFQFSKNEAERKIHGLTLFHTFLMVLDVFSDFLVLEQKVVPQEWQTQLHWLRQCIQTHHAELKKTLPLDEGAKESFAAEPT